MQRVPLILVVGLVACTSGDSGDSGGGDTGPAPVNPDAPAFTEARVECYEHTTGETFVQWAASAVVTDKQGDSTVETFGRVVVSDARGELGQEDLLCASGACSASWKDSDGPDVECDPVALGATDFAFYAVDIDGHESAAFVVHGERTEEGGG